MNRTIKFRGKRVDNGEWVEGGLLAINNHYEIGWQESSIYEIEGGWDQYEVQSNTVGQFTGLHDKNGKEIYEGDIVKMSTAMYGDEIFRIGYEDSHIGAFCLCSDEQEDTSRFVSIFGRNYGYEPFYCEVIGNIHDKPELMEGGRNGR